MSEDVYAYSVRLPDGIHGYTVKGSNPNEYTIYLDNRLTYEQSLKTYMHEIQHIHDGDFDTDLSVGEIETKTHRED